MRKKIQIALLLAIVISGGRAAYILHQRRIDQKEPVNKEASPLDADYYVSPKKLYPYDLKSARELTRQPAWIKVGYSSTYYPCGDSGHPVDFAHPAGLLKPLQKLTIQNVVTAVAPAAPGQQQVMVVFEMEDKRYAFPIGTAQNGDYQIYSDEMLFIQDPHELYKHWPADVWQAIDNHEAKRGMSELQTGFAIGLGIPQDSGAMGERTLNYDNGGKPLSISFHRGKAVEIRPNS